MEYAKRQQGDVRVVQQEKDIPMVNVSVALQEHIHMEIKIHVHLVHKEHTVEMKQEVAQNVQGEHT